jgi:23S rRNA (guanine745-N1)-methyltransferase
MPDTLDDLLLCPVCGSAVRVSPRLLLCESGHRFDAARQGYFNLLTGKGTRFEADSIDMVDARVRFLGSGHYLPLRDALAELALRHRAAPPSAARAVIVDAGAGTGYYLRGVTDGFPGAVPVALDISKFALRRAARELPGGLALVWDLWRPLPVRSGTAHVLLNVFAPRNIPEFVRVLAPGGVLLVATPLPGHLGEAARTVPLLEVPAHKAQDLADSFDGRLVELERREIEYPMSLPPAALADVALMGPAARHLDRGALDELLTGTGADTVVTARFTVQAFGPR